MECKGTVVGCPKKGARTQVTAMEPIAADLASDLNEELKECPMEPVMPADIDIKVDTVAR